MPTKPSAKPALYNIAKNISGQWSGNHDTFYHSNRWRTLRKQLITANPLCVECSNNGRVTLAKVVDHIHSVRLGGDKWDIDNLQSLCESCHNTKTSKESKQYV